MSLADKGAPSRISAFETAGTAFGLLLQNPQLLLLAFIGSLLGMVCSLLLQPLGLAIAALYDPTVTTTVSLSFAVGLAVVAFVTSWLTLVPVMMLAQAGVERLLGDRIGLAEAFTETMPRFFPVLGLGLLWFVVFVASAALLFIPALILMAIWMVAFQVCLFEELDPIDSLARSRTLTRGNRWRLTLVYLLCAVLLIIPVALVAGLAAFIFLDEFLGRLAGAIIGTVNYGFTVLYLTVAYARLAAAVGEGQA